MNKLLYIHGFNSSSKSFKAQQFQHYCAELGLADHFICPDLDDQPIKAMAQLEQIITEQNISGIVGSSLGGFYGLYLAQKHQIKLAMVNPAVRPWLLLQKHLGMQKNYHRDHQWLLTDETVASLKQFDVEIINQPENVRIYLQTADETLDYRDALTRYDSAEIILEQGGDHSFTDFDRYFDSLLTFFAIGK